MKIAFTKMTGAGNDMIMIDNRDRKIELNTFQIQQLCNRNFGIGGDGLVLIEPGLEGADFRMRYYNPDGGEAVCGNGSRCFARLIQKLTGKNEMTFMTPAGVMNAKCEGEMVTLGMVTPTNIQLNQTVPLSVGKKEIHLINTGVPHSAIFVDDLISIQVNELGREIRNHKLYTPAGTNANFVKVTGPQRIEIRTYERGVEAETLACGTGITASALLAHLVKDLPAPISVGVKSGCTLQVNFTRNGDGFKDVTMTGPADFIYSGEINL